MMDFYKKTIIFLFAIIFVFVIVVEKQNKEINKLKSEECPYTYLRYNFDSKDKISVYIDYENVGFDFYKDGDFMAIAYRDHKEFHNNFEATFYSNKEIETRYLNGDCFERNWDDEIMELKEGANCYTYQYGFINRTRTR